MKMTTSFEVCLFCRTQTISAMKKIFILAISIFITQQTYGQLQGTYWGNNYDTWMINKDYTANVDANLRLSTNTSGGSKRSWNIFHESSDNDLYFGYSTQHDPMDGGDNKMILHSSGLLDITSYIRHMGSPSTYIGFGGGSQFVIRITGSDRFFVNSSGNIGVGTIYPDNKLDVAGGIDINDYIRHNGDENTYIGFGGNDQFRVRTNNADRIFVNSSGDVGIGTTSPGEKLHVNGSVRGNQSGALRISTGSGYVDIGPKNTSWSHFSTDRSRFHFNKGLTVDQGLIGSHNENLQLQTSGTTRLTLSNSSGDATFTHDVNANGTKYSGDGKEMIRFSDSWLRLNPSNAFTNGTYLAGKLRTDGKFEVGPNGNRLVVNSDGKIGIGTTDPTEGQLHIYRNATTGGWGGVTPVNAGLKIQDSGATLYIDGNTLYTTSTMHIGPISNSDLNLGTNDTPRITVKADGKTGIGTSAPAHELSVKGKLSIANTEDETVDYIRLYHDGEANLSTKEGALQFNKGTEKYFGIEDKRDSVTRLYAYQEEGARELVLRASPIPQVEDPNVPLGDLTIKTDGTVVIEKGLEINGGGNISFENVSPDNSVESVLAINPDGKLASRSVESLTPWVIRQIYHDADTINLFTCNPHAEGDTCTCATSHITIDSMSIIDIQGNLMLGDQGFIDNDNESGPNRISGDGVWSDDYLRIQKFVEVSANDSTKGFVVKDRRSSSNSFLNLYHDNGVSYFSHATVSTPKEDYFMKIGDGSSTFKDVITFRDRVTFNNGFETSSFVSKDQMVFAMDIDSTDHDALFRVGRGTSDFNNETNWFGLFYVDQNGLASFSSDIGDETNPNLVTIDGATGKITTNGAIEMGGDLSLGGTLENPKVYMESTSGNITSSGDITIGGTSSVTENQSIGGYQTVGGTSTITGQLNVLGGSDIVTGSFGRASEWNQSYANRVIARNGLTWNSTTKELDVKLGSGLYFDVSGNIATYFEEDGTDQLSYNGSMAIGTTNHYGYELAVGGDIVAEEINLKLEEDWPDYVFEQDYELQSLAKTEKYIAKNKHLPDMPSASEVATEGINLGEMNALLLKKIEEMTLHMIAMEKRIQELESK